MTTRWRCYGGDTCTTPEYNRHSGITGWCMCESAENAANQQIAVRVRAINASHAPTERISIRALRLIEHNADQEG